MEIHVIVPQEKSEIIGKGVYQSESTIKFVVHKLPEYKTWYGREFFRGFISLLSNIKPNIIVATWPYNLGFIFLPSVLVKFKSSKIKLILKEIPFNIPVKKDDINFYINRGLYSENAERIKYNKSLLSFVKIKLITFTRIIMFNVADAHVNYTTAAYEILGSYGVKPEKIFITYNSPDTTRLLNVKKELDQENIIPKIHRIIHVGRLVKWKKVDLLIDSVTELKKEFPDIELLIIGDGPEKQYLVNLTRERNLEENIKFIGGVYSPKDLGRYLMKSSVYILAGMGGLSLNEAMSFGKPIICSVCDGTERELVIEGFNGYFFKEGDKMDLVLKIKKIFMNVEKTIEMGENSYYIIKNKINIDTVIRGYRQAFDYVCEK